MRLKTNAINADYAGCVSVVSMRQFSHTNNLYLNVDKFSYLTFSSRTPPSPSPAPYLDTFLAMKQKVLDRLCQVCVVLVIHHLYFDTLYTCVGVHVCVNKCI